MARQLDLFAWRTLRHRIASVESYWNHSRLCAAVLCIFAIAFTLVANLRHFLPGVSIAVLGVMAAVVSLRPLMRIAEKAVWCAIFAGVLVAEIRSIREDRTQNNETQVALRNEQNTKFAGIAGDLQTAVNKSQSQYDDTVHHVDNVLTETKNVLSTTQALAKTAQDNLLNVTGGESYAYVWPTTTIGNPGAILNLHNFGQQALSITVTIYAGTASYESASAPFLENSYGALYIGPVAPGEGRVIPPPRGDILPRVGIDGIAHYHIYINQQNTGVNEYLDFRPALSAPGWAYKLTVLRAATGRRRKTDVFTEGHWIRYLKVTDWIEPGYEPKKPY